MWQGGQGGMGHRRARGNCNGDRFVTPVVAIASRRNTHVDIYPTAHFEYM